VTAVLASLLLLAAATSDAAPTVRQVLVLESFDHGFLVLDYLTGRLRVDLEERIGGPVKVVQVVVGRDGPVGASEQTIVDYLRATYAPVSKPDLIIAMAGPATVFARTYRQQLFPDTPLLLAGPDQRRLRDAPLEENEVAVAVQNDIPHLMDEILQLLPGTRQVFMVTGAGPIGAFWHHELDTEFRRFHDRLTFMWSDDLSLAETLRRCANLPSGSAIFYIALATDAEGGRIRTSECSPPFARRRMHPCSVRIACWSGTASSAGR